MTINWLDARTCWETYQVRLRIELTGFHIFVGNSCE